MLTLEMIGFRIKQAREDKKLSQTQLVEMLGSYGIAMSRETLSKIENGSRSISALEIKGICQVLSLEAEALLEEEQEENLVTLFRGKEKYEDALPEIEEIQEMVKGFIFQKKLYNGEVNTKKRTPMWRS
ncbi:helix-turn-helix domain protein [Alkaliphilus metalliredigens QYMF]|uniref:Helix-turn-helix domain protein n=1 Tax=Alkaliphilus metalliredigens (strain QYMF) TaxID=293826 RepID=A6TLL2_ALKMQ|nr:helix-turn-helix transcriptional regulator [Alkaliphilus metalliredigens]ABR47080.1 helix-turn-helix domain protein [Alkaliphilus metalliredigens QYMF]